MTRRCFQNAGISFVTIFGVHVFQLTVGIPMGSNCTLRFTGWPIPSLLSGRINSWSYPKEGTSLSQVMWSCFLAMYMALCFKTIYSKEVDIKHMLTYSLGSMETEKIMTKLYMYVNSDDFIFHFIIFPFICGTSFNTFISQLIPRARACQNYKTFYTMLDFYNWVSGTVICCYKVKVTTTKKFNRPHKLVDRYGVAIYNTRTDSSNKSVFPSLFVYLGRDILWATRSGCF